MTDQPPKQTRPGKPAAAPPKTPEPPRDDLRGVAEHIASARKSIAHTRELLKSGRKPDAEG